VLLPGVETGTIACSFKITSHSEEASEANEATNDTLSSVLACSKKPEENICWSTSRKVRIGTYKEQGPMSSKDERGGRDAKQKKKSSKVSKRKANSEGLEDRLVCGERCDVQETFSATHVVHEQTGEGGQGKVGEAHRLIQSNRFRLNAYKANRKQVRERADADDLSKAYHERRKQVAP